MTVTLTLVTVKVKMISEGIELTSVPVGNKIIDMQVLNENVSSQLVCRSILWT